jgi:hypothetical protein
VQLSVRATMRFWQPIAQRISATPESRAAIRVTGRGMVIVMLLASVTVTLVGAGVGVGVVFEVEGFFVGDAVTVDADPVGDAVMVGDSVGCVVGTEMGSIVGEGNVDPVKYVL